MIKLIGRLLKVFVSLTLRPTTLTQGGSKDRRTDVLGTHGHRGGHPLSLELTPSVRGDRRSGHIETEPNRLGSVQRPRPHDVSVLHYPGVVNRPGSPPPVPHMCDALPPNSGDSRRSRVPVTGPRSAASDRLLCSRQEWSTDSVSLPFH